MVSFIDAHRGMHGVEPICSVLAIAPSTYYSHLAKRADLHVLVAESLPVVELPDEICGTSLRNDLIPLLRRLRGKAHLHGALDLRGLGQPLRFGFLRGILRDLPLPFLIGARITGGITAPLVFAVLQAPLAVLLALHDAHCRLRVMPHVLRKCVLVALGQRRPVLAEKSGQRVLAVLLVDLSSQSVPALHRAENVGTLAGLKDQVRVHHHAPSLRVR